MRPLLAIVGRPNVGKSTLFNRLVGGKQAIVFDTPGVTRDRHYGEGDWSGHFFDVVDTGGFEPDADEGIPAHMRRQAMMAVEEAEVVLFMVDGREGMVPADEEVAEILRRASEKLFVVVNKLDGQEHDALSAEFYAMGVERLFPVSAEHGRGVGRLLDAVIKLLPPPPKEIPEDPKVTRIALLGRPNAGKSTLANQLLGEERMIVDSTAGTTRDSIDSQLTWREKEYLLIDTAGLRRQRRIRRKSSEGFSVMRTIRAIERCHVAVLLIDAIEGVTDQDARIAGLAHEKGRALILAVNKWDVVEKDSKTAQAFQERLELKLPFVQYAPVVFISGLTGQRCHKLMEWVALVRESHLFRAPTGVLNRWLKESLERHHPPIVKGRRLRMHYATQARIAPPTIVIFCNHPDLVHFSYHRFLMNRFLETFKLKGTPVRVAFKGKKNPYLPEES